MFSIFLFFISVLLSTFAYAAEPSQEESLPSVVVISTRLQDVEEEASKVPGKVIVITAEEIQRLGAKTVQEVLQYQTGVVLYDQIGTREQDKGLPDGELSALVVSTREGGESVLAASAVLAGVTAAVWGIGVIDAYLSGTDVESLDAALAQN